MSMLAHMLVQELLAAVRCYLENQLLFNYLVLNQSCTSKDEPFDNVLSNYYNCGILSFSLQFVGQFVLSYSRLWGPAGVPGGI
jgi:hypothetical protein